MARSLLLSIVTCLPFAVALCSLKAEDVQFSAAQIEFFENHVRPVLVSHCYDCHSTDAKELKAGLYVDSREGLIEGGESGPAVVAGHPDESPLIAAIRYEANEMPPDKKLASKEIEALVKWVEMGAPWPRVTSSPAVQPAPAGQPIDWPQARASHWAWQPIARPPVPDVASEAMILNTIDRFVEARRQQAGLTAGSLAPPHVLARRIYLDLVGFVPQPSEVQEFVRATQVDRQRAVSELVNRLLQSPAYGQRWARHWLDVARYSDGRGGFLDSDSLENAWRYRDWVVDAINNDQPVDQFIKLQIAGDIIGSRDDAIATGFFAVGPTYRSDGGDPDSVAQAKGETLDDRVDTLTRGLLGITGSCARCHDHKFDPIPQQDYYSLAGVFNNSEVHDLPLADQDVVDQVNQHKQRVNDLNRHIAELRQVIKRESRDATAAEQSQLDDWQAQLDEQQKNPPPGFGTAHALHDTGDSDMHVAIRGNLRKTGELAPRRFLRIIAGQDPPGFVSGSGRGELAEAVVDPDNPLTARVFVNRVWMHHFGNGLVRTPSNFGSLGEAPTHPNLLDWLAADFVQNGWSLKRLHRQIMTSATYQLSSAYRAASYDVDGDNRLLWRMSPRRMDAEAWRDSLLAVCGELDCSLGGPSLAEITKSPRRTLYAKISRNGDVFEADALLRRFDFPLMRATVAKRTASIVPQQFLFLLNSPFMVDRARALSGRLHAEATTDEDRIVLVYNLLYCRRPEASELRLGTQFLSSEFNNDNKLTAWEQYAQALLSSNEFMYVR